MTFRTALFLLMIFLGTSFLLRALECLKRDPFSSISRSIQEQKNGFFLLQGIARTNATHAALISCNKKTYLVSCGDRCKNYHVKHITDTEVCLHNSAEDIVLKLDQERK